MARKSKYGPATDPELLILSSLASGPKHGYAMMIDIQEFANVEVGPGTLYVAITRLVERRHIAPTTEVGRQRPYKLTAAGATFLKQQLSDMRRVATIGMGRLRLA